MNEERNMANAKKNVTETAAAAAPAPAKKETAAKKPAPAKKEATAAKAPAKTTTAAAPAPTKKKTTAAAKPAPAKKETAAKKPAPAAEKKHILFIAAEAWPFAGTGGLGEVIGSLPRALNHSTDVEARVMLPLYGTVPERFRDKMKFVKYIYVPLSWRNQYCGLFELTHEGVTYYFVDNEYYFKRDGLYGYGDEGERFAFFSRAAVELIPHLGWRVDVLHAHDWHAALVPVYYKLYGQYQGGMGGIKTLFTIHNIEYQGQFAGETIEDLFGISRREYPSVEWGGCINLMKAAIDYSDAVSTVSETYAKEIMTAEYAHGLEGVLLKNSGKLFGILNGIDTDVYNPAANESLFANYDVTDVKRCKAENKVGLQRMLNLPENKNIPMVAMITRLASHKGLDIVRAAFNEIMGGDVQFVVLGTGDADHENYFRHMQHVYGERVRAVIAFNKDMAQKIYAGADIFLMPSRSEPCGLSQMMAMRYGTIPVVRSTGGLNDSVEDCGDGHTGNGFRFDEYSGGALAYAVARAVGLYRYYRDIWDGLVERAMKCDFGWERSAKKYIEYYKKIIG